MDKDKLIKRVSIKLDKSLDAQGEFFLGIESSEVSSFLNGLKNDLGLDQESLGDFIQ